MAARAAGSEASSRIASCQSGKVAGRQQHARLGDDHFAGAVDVIADHGAAHQERLRQDARKPLAKTGVNDGVDRIQ